MKVVEMRRHSLITGVAAMRSFWRSLLQDNHGVATIEYGLIAAMVALVGTTGMSDVGKSVAQAFYTVEAALSGNPAEEPPPSAARPDAPI